MRASYRPLAPGETDVELLTLATSAGCAVTAGSWALAGLPLPRCAFHSITGCPCPTCGATRCLLALVHGHPLAALAWNPMAFAAIAILIPLNIYSALVLAGRLPRARLSLGPAEGRFLRLASFLLLAANWAYEVHHGV